MLNKLLRVSAAILVISLLARGPVTLADGQRVVYETEIDADIEAVWKAFTTNQGLQSWMAPLVEIDLVVGGTMKSNYNAEGKIGDATTIENTILAYDPQRMLSLRASRFPDGFPFVEAAKKTWSVFYFSELPNSQTKITVVGLGYTDDEDSKQMRSFFAVANERSLAKLNATLQKDQPESE